MSKVDNLSPTQYLIMEVLAARFRTGEPFWTFPSRLAPQVKALAAAGLVELMHGIAENTVRARLTREGQDETLDASYSVPTPTLVQALDTLPSTNEQYLAWMREHGLGQGAGIGTVVSLVRADLRKLMGGNS
jgi:hypothetical protein